MYNRTTLHGRVILNPCLQTRTCYFWIIPTFLLLKAASGSSNLVLVLLLSLQSCLCICQEEELERLEREFAIQSQITEAARRLASDPHVSSKKLKKQRKTSYLNALKKLQEIENSINEYRVRSGKKPTQRASLIIEGTNKLRVHLGKIKSLSYMSYQFAVIATTDSNILICTVI